MAKSKGAVFSGRLTAIMWIVWKLWIKRGSFYDKGVKTSNKNSKSGQF